jgi:hypothetical protein
MRYLHLQFLLLLILLSVSSQAQWYKSKEIHSNASGYFGKSIDIAECHWGGYPSVQYMLVGAPYEDNGAGAVYLYSRSQQNYDTQWSEWELKQKIPHFTLQVSDTLSYDFQSFGTTVAITCGANHRAIAISTPETKIHYETLTFEKDGLVIYDYNTTTKTFEPLSIRLENHTSYFTKDIDISSVYYNGNQDGLLVASTFPSENLVKFYRYDYNTQTWDDSNITGDPDTKFGQSVAVSDFELLWKPNRNYVIIGAPDTNITWQMITYRHRGSATVFKYENTGSGAFQWVEQYRLSQPIPDIHAGESINQDTNFGIDTDITPFGDKLIVAARREGVTQDTSTQNRGEAYIYSINETSGEKLTIPSFKGDSAEVYSAAISQTGDHAILGTPNLTIEVCSSDGGAFIYEFNKKWQLSGIFSHSGDNHIGSAVKISGEIMHRAAEAYVGMDSASTVGILKKSYGFIPVITNYLLQ